MNTLNIITLCLDCFGADNGWHNHWHFPVFFLLFLLMCFMFLRWRRGSYSCWEPRWGRYSDYERNDAKKILKNRYAKGEISKEVFDDMMNEISKESNSKR